jgi:hypothetical protein
MKHKRTMAWTAAAAVFCALLIGWFTLQSGADQAVSPHPHDKANHHPKSGDGSSN